MTLLNDIMPIEDDRLFYLTGAGITVMYRPYEITTGLDPWPELSIPLSNLKLEEYGMQVDDVTDHEEWVTALAPVWDFFKSEYGADGEEFNGDLSA